MFGADAVRLAELMIGIQNECTKPDDPRSTYLMEGVSYSLHWTP